MEFMGDPNLIYLLLTGGLVLAVLALASPGTGYLEVGAFFILAVAGWSIVAFNLPINWWALVSLGAGAVLFVLSIRKKQPWLLLVPAIIALAAGSAYLFRSESWYLPAVNPLLAVVVSFLSVGFFWLVGHKAIEAAQVLPSHDLERLVGKVGQAKTRIEFEGSVQVESELWSARSTSAVPEGGLVRVVGLEGFVLQVEPLEKHTKQE